MPLLNKEEIKAFYEVWKQGQDDKTGEFLEELMFPGLKKHRKGWKNHRWVKAIKKRLKRLGAKK